MKRDPRIGRLAAGAAALAALGALAGCGGSSSSTPAAPTGPVVSLKLLQFQPTELTVPVGTEVTWRNDEPIGHTVTTGTVTGVDATTGLRSGQKPDGQLDKRLAGKGDTATFTFTKAGTYSYYCSIHKGMNATVTVTGASDSK